MAGPRHADGRAYDASSARSIQRGDRAVPAQPSTRGARCGASVGAASRPNVGIGFRRDSNFYTGFTADISEGGLFVATHMLQRIGAELTLTFALPTGPEISVRGVVRWSRDAHDYNSAIPPGMGVQFQGIPVEDAARIRELVALREPLFFVS